MKIQAVKTTGIYCRCDCGARPNKKNVRPMPNQIAAMASGFRPCLVCRPDRLPEIGLGQAALEIAHAVRLITEGFLDGQSTDELAERVGYSTRHLVRLFEKHIGASPDFVARARRAHMARRLLDESDLTITNVAFASGFSSVRQMNRVVRDLFDFSPSELRKKRKRNDELDPLDGGLRLRVPFEPPLDVSRIIEYLGPRAIPGIEFVETGCYKRTMSACGCPGVIEIRDSSESHIDVTMHLPTFGSIVDQVERVRSLFGVNRNLAAAHKHLRKDSLLGSIVRKQLGLRLPGAWDRFETAVRIIFGQQISVVGASTLTGRLVERFGETIDAPLPDSMNFLFPNANTLAKSVLAKLGVPESRAKTIQRFSAAVANGDIDLTFAGALEDSVEMLTQVPGIGPWTAHFIAGRVMGIDDAFPASDLGLRHAVTTLLGKSKTVSAAEVEMVAEAWRPYRFVAAGYLWMSTKDQLTQKNQPKRKR